MLSVFLLAGVLLSAPVPRPPEKKLTRDPLTRILWLRKLEHDAKRLAEYTGWEIYQGLQRGQEVFVVYTCMMCEEGGGYAVYDRRGRLIRTGLVVHAYQDSLKPTELRSSRCLVKL